MRFLTSFYSTGNFQHFQPCLLSPLLLPPCAHGFPDCPEWGAGEERPVNVLIIKRSEEKLLHRPHCHLDISFLKASEFAMHHWHEMKAKLLNVIKIVAVLTRKKCCPFNAHVVLLLLGAPGYRSGRFGCIHEAWCSATKSWHWSP